MGALEVDAFAGRVGGNEHADIGIGTKEGLRLLSLVAMGAAVDRDNGVRGAEHARDLGMKVIQRVAMFGENSEGANIQSA